MARILIAWELGEAFGHFARCLALAEGLCRNGHDVVLALRNVRLPAGQSLPPHALLVPAPLSFKQDVVRRSPVNYADLLLGCGYSDSRDIAARLNAWNGILRLARPDFTLGDHAPTALFASHLNGISHAAIGSGFMIPPAAKPWSSIRPSGEISDDVLLAAEDRLDQMTELAQKELGLSQRVRMRELFSSQDILDTFSELDHYGERADGCYIGPVGAIPNTFRVGWQSRDGAKVLAYMRKGVPGFFPIMQALARLHAEVLCVVPGMNANEAKRLATRNMRIAVEPVELKILLGCADIAVGYGNSGFSTSALLSGVPVAMRPQHVEQTLFAQRVEALGAGKLLIGQLDAEGVLASLRELLEDPRYLQTARAFKQRYQHFSPACALKQAVSHIEHALAS